VITTYRLTEHHSGGIRIEPRTGPEPNHTLANLHAGAEKIAAADRQRKQAEAERKRIAALQELVKAEEPQARALAEAVSLLVQLRDLAVVQHKLPQF
jgi:hypothetical protein